VRTHGQLRGACATIPMMRRAELHGLLGFAAGASFGLPPHLRGRRSRVHRLGRQRHHQHHLGERAEAREPQARPARAAAARAARRAAARRQAEASLATRRAWRMTSRTAATTDRSGACERGAQRRRGRNDGTSRLTRAGHQPAGPALLASSATTTAIARSGSRCRPCSTRSRRRSDLLPVGRLRRHGRDRHRRRRIYFGIYVDNVEQSGTRSATTQLRTGGCDCARRAARSTSRRRPMATPGRTGMRPRARRSSRAPRWSSAAAPGHGAERQPYRVRQRRRAAVKGAGRERCQLGLRQVSVAPNGRLYPCVQFVGDGSESRYAIGDGPAPAWLPTASANRRLAPCAAGFGACGGPLVISGHCVRRAEGMGLAEAWPWKPRV